VSDTAEIIETITAGGKLGETVEILYRDTAGRVSTTETEPYEIRGGVYVCWCGLRNRLVEIVISSIVDAVMTGTPYKPRFQPHFED
jgi:predicted DNA-binding transcriptional regulator YafY